MRRKLKGIRVLIFALSVLISFCLTYPPGDSLGEIHFLSRHITLGNFEIADQEDLGTDPPAQSKEIISAFFSSLSHMGILPFRDSFPSAFHPFCLEQKVSILRC